MMFTSGVGYDKMMRHPVWPRFWCVIPLLPRGPGHWGPAPAHGGRGFNRPAGGLAALSL